MKISDIPAKFTIPFANAAGGGYIRSVPQASQIGITNGAASLTDGFPPLTFLPVGSGGVPPFGQDFNGLLKQITQWNRWSGAGGVAAYDSAFSTAIGGYPLGSILAGAAGIVYISTVDDNTSNPTTGGAGWTLVANVAGVQSGKWISATDTGSASALVVTLSPAISSYTKYLAINVQVANTATGASSININGLGPKSIVDANGGVILAGSFQAGNILNLIYDGSAFRLVSGFRTLPSIFFTTYGTPFSVSNNVITQCIIAASANPSTFGSFTTTTFTFSRAGTYAVAGSVTVNLSTSSATSCAGAMQLRQNGNSIPGGSSGDSSYLPTGTSISFTQYATGVINAAVGDTVTVFASIGANTGFTSGNIAATALNITLIS